jgi:hypothetical protein
MSELAHVGGAKLYVSAVCWLNFANKEQRTAGESSISYDHPVSTRKSIVCTSYVLCTIIDNSTSLYILILSSY